VEDLIQIADRKKATTHGDPKEGNNARMRKDVSKYARTHVRLALTRARARRVRLSPLSTTGQCPPPVALQTPVLLSGVRPCCLMIGEDWSRQTQS